MLPPAASQWTESRSRGTLPAMFTSATYLRLRLRTASDDEAILAMGAPLFAPYSKSPRRVLQAMIQEAGADTLVAFDKETPAGFFILSYTELGRPYGPWEAPKIARLNAIGVRRDAQGTGVGSLLLERAESHALSEGACVMVLLTGETNYRARQLFESTGYRYTLPVDGVYKNGQRALSMTKVLDV